MGAHRPQLAARSILLHPHHLPPSQLNSFLHGEANAYPEPSRTTAKHPEGFRKFAAAIYTLNCRVLVGNYVMYGRAGKEALQARTVDAGEIAAIAFGPPPPPPPER